MKPVKETIEWYPITTRDMTEEEADTWRRETGYEYDYLTFLPKMYDGIIPDDAEDVLLQTRYGMDISTFNDTEEGMWFEDYEQNEVIAWARLPKGIKREE